MDEKDLQQIKRLFQDEFKTGFREGFTEVWEGNLKPAFNTIFNKIDQLPQSPMFKPESR